MSTQSYFLNVSSKFRNNQLYPNPTDFAVSFQQNQSTGVVVNGNPN